MVSPPVPETDVRSMIGRSSDSASRCRDAYDRWWRTWVTGRVAMNAMTTVASAAIAGARARSRRADRAAAVGTARGHRIAAPPRAVIDLGRRLFFDRRLSFNGTLSCGMCHVPEQGFTQNELATPVGFRGRESVVATRRRSTTWRIGRGCFTTVAKARWNCRSGRRCWRRTRWRIRRSVSSSNAIAALSDYADAFVRCVRARSRRRQHAARRWRRTSEGCCRRMRRSTVGISAATRRRCRRRASAVSRCLRKQRMQRRVTR